MTPEQFTYWLQGFSEVTNQSPTPEQWKIIQDHLKTVFYKVTPFYSKDHNLPFKAELDFGNGKTVAIC